LVWELSSLTARSPDPARTLSKADLERLWQDLADANAAKAYQGLWRLIGAPARAVPFLGERLHAVPRLDPLRVPRLISDLDSDQFDLRRQATRELEHLADMAETTLRGALKGHLSVEAARRVEQLLKKREGKILPADGLRVLRAQEALEHIGTPE